MLTTSQNLFVNENRQGGTMVDKYSHNGSDTGKDEMEGIFSITPEQRSSVVSTSVDFLSSDLSSKIKHFYDTQGYVLIRGLIDPEMLRRLQCAGDKVIEETAKSPYSNFTSVQFGGVFSSPPSADGGSRDDEQSDQAAFREVALKSAVPAFISRILMKLKNDGDSETNATNLRLLNDVFLAKTGKEETFCGWHVDDVLFWPCSAHQDPSTPVGVNAWIAMDDIPAKTYGGGMAIVPKSHLEDCEWRQRGYDAIGSTRNHPAEGFSSTAEMARSSPKARTCFLSQLDPELNGKLETMKKVFDYQQGDVLLCSRWLWHRSMQLGEEGHKNISDEDLEGAAFKRYTVRYECGDSRLLSGASFQDSVLYNPSNAGKTLNHICSTSGLPFFPQAWPTVLESEYSRMEELTKEILPKLTEKRLKMLHEMTEIKKKEGSA